MFNFNGKSAKDFPWLRVKSITGSILPPLQRRYITVPSKPGAYHAGRDVGIRQERITIKVNGGTMEQLMERRRILAEWLDTEQSAPFFYDHEPHRIYRAVLSGETNLDQILYYGEAELIFEMPDPYAESRDKKTALLQGTTVRKLFTDFSEEGTLIDLVADENGMRLAKEGQDFIVGTDTNWEEGTHNNTVEVDNEYLQLKKGPDIERIYPDQIDWDDPENVQNGMGNLADYLGLIDLPEWNFIDYMRNYTSQWRIQSPTAGGEVIQEDEYVTIRGTASGANFGIDTQYNTNPDVIVRFPCTVYILYRGRNSDGARFIIEDGTTYGFTIRFQGDDDNTWNHYWIRCTTTEAYVYKNGTLIDTVSVRSGGGAANQMQFDIQNGTSADYDIGAIYVDWDFDKGPPPEDGWFSGTWETSYIDLSSVTLVETASIGWTFWYDTANRELRDEDTVDYADVQIEYQLRKNGIEQGWKTVFDDPFDEGPNDILIPDIPSGADLSGTEIKIRVTFRTRDPDASPLLEYLLLNLTSQYPANGYWESPVISDVQQVGKAERSEVTWAINSQPQGTSVGFYVRYRLDSEEDWSEWIEVENSGDPFPEITPDTDLSNAQIQYRVELSTSDTGVTPSVDWVRLGFYTGYKPSGQWLSPPISLAPANIIGDSRIFWTWSGEETVQVEARLNGGDWQSVTNDGEIPGVRGTEGATLEIRVTLSTSDINKTPEFYLLEVMAREQSEAEIVYEGTESGFPRLLIDVTDEVDEIRIMHLETGKFILLQDDFEPGDQIVVDHYEETITLNGVYRLNFLNIRSRFFKLVKGTNSFEISPETGVVVKLEWVERWK